MGISSAAKCNSQNYDNKSVFIGPRCPWGPIYVSGPMSVSTTLCADLTDVTLADEDSNSIPTDDVNRAIPGNVAMQVAPPGGQN